MFKSVIGCSLVFGAALSVGCKEDQTKQAAPAAATPAATQPSVPETVAPAAPAAAAPATEAAPIVAPPVAVPEAPASAPAAAGTTDAASQSLLDEVKQDIKDKKWDDADSALKKLEAMKDQLPANWQDELKALRTAITTGKAASGLKIPGVGQ